MSEHKSVLRRNRGKILVAIAALLVAVAATVGSGAVWSASSSNLGNTVATGNLALDDSKTGAIFAISNLAPGHDGTGSVVLNNTGTVPGSLQLTQTGFTDTPGTAGTLLSGQLNVVITDNGSEIYNGTFANLQSNPVSPIAMAPSTPHTVVWTVTLPSGSGNSYQDTGINVGYSWMLTST
jgi:spore coat-associated protein N